MSPPGENVRSTTPLTSHDPAAELSRRAVGFFGIRARMQLVRLVPCLALVACGGGSNPQQQPLPDTGTPDTQPDGMPDTTTDGPNDTPGLTVARVWAIGDIITNNTNIAGGFDADATLPFDSANPPTIVVPGGAAKLSTQTDNVFDARGSKIAYIADQTVAGRFDLNVADADGSNPIIVITGDVANVEVSSVALSPDGTKVAFTMDSPAVNGGVDLYFAPTTAAATPVLISPSRGNTVNPNQDVFSQYTWSPDSKLVAFSADLTDDGFDQAYVTDTSVATPTPVEILTRADITATTGTRGVRGRILFDADNNVYFRARVSDASTQFTFFKSDPAGTKAAVTLPARGDASTPDIGAFAITPDGASVVFSTDAPNLGRFDLYKASTADLANPTKITDLADVNGATLNATFTAPMAFSPDGTKVAVVANFLSGGDNTAEPFVIALDGSATTRLTSVPKNTNQDSELVVWTDNTTVFVQGDIVTSNDTALYKLDASMTDQAPTPAVNVPQGGDIFNVFVVLP